ncbi:MAG: AtpZ/AtpI family protein [Patescibacteria group bacterium]|nr:AtpZ/AtpI family protein [Patescibacteria group bacterium]
MEDKPKKQSNDHGYYVLGVRIMLDMGFSIAIPAVAAAFAGQYLDEKYDKAPLFLILFLVNAFLISAQIIITKAKRYGQEYENLDK